MRAAAVFLLLLSACSDRVELQTVTLRLRTPEAGPCRPTSSPTDLVIEALGDFPASDERSIDVLRPMEAPGVIDRFPAGTRALTIRARSDRWAGFGALPAIGDRDRDASILLLPPDEPCLVADPALADRNGALVPLADGSLVLLGGSEGEVGSRRLVHWRSGEAAAAVLDPGLQVRRDGVAAVRVGERVFALGGALGAEGPAHDTFEIYDASEGAMQEGLGTLGAPRRDAGAVRLPDGRLLLVGGRTTGGGAPLASGELLDPDTFAVEPTGAMPTGRAAPLVRVLDDGSIVIVGGVGAGGGPLRELVAFDPRSATFVELGLRAPADPSAAVPLPGGRLAVFAASRPGELTLYRNAPPILGSVPGLVERTVALDLPPLTALVATGLLDGALLVAGVDGEGERRAFVVEVGTAAVRELPPPRAHGRLVTLTDGASAALDDAGLALRRVSERSPFGHPPASLLAEDLALDAPGRWRSEAASLVAEEGDARADLAGLRFADVAITIESRGSVELLLQPDGAPANVIRIEEREVGPSLCTVEAEGPVRFERRGQRLIIERAGERRECRLDGLTGRVGLAFRARAGDRFDRIEARRLETDR